MRNFSPLQFRELKVGRFSDFTLKILYRKESVFVAEICSKVNSDDIRLVSFVDVSEMLPSNAGSSDRMRLLMFEALFNEAADLMRSLQGKSRKDYCGTGLLYITEHFSGYVLRLFRNTDIE